MAAFALGFAAGTCVGSLVEEWMALGQALIRIIAPVETDPVAPLLRRRGYGATVINGDGMNGEVRITFCVIPRKEVPQATALIRVANPRAFVTVEHTATVDMAARGGRDVEK